MKKSVVFILTLLLCKFVPMFGALRCYTCNSIAVPDTFERGAIEECKKVEEEETCKTNQNVCINMLTMEKRTDVFKREYYVYRKGCSHVDCRTIEKNKILGGKSYSLISCKECRRDGCNIWDSINYVNYIRCHTCNYGNVVNFGVPRTSESAAIEECKKLEEEQSCEINQNICLSAMTTVTEGVHKGKYVYRKGCSYFNCDTLKTSNLSLALRSDSWVTCNECKRDLCNKWNDSNNFNNMRCHKCDIDDFFSFESQAKGRCEQLEKEETCKANKTICLSAMMRAMEGEHKGKYMYVKDCWNNGCDILKKKLGAEFVSCNDCRSDLCNKWNDSNNGNNETRRCYRCNFERVPNPRLSEWEAKGECKKSEEKGICLANQNFCVSMMMKETEGINKGKYMYVKDCWDEDCNVLKKKAPLGAEIVSCTVNGG